MESICGADCKNCEYGKKSKCKGCAESNGCPFGTQCFIAKYIQTGTVKQYESFKKTLIDEFNALNISGMPRITELYPLNGAFVNIEYPLPSGKCVKLLNDNAVYLGNQVCCEFDDGEGERCFGLVAAPEFLLVSEYGENCENPEIVAFLRR